MHLKYSFELFKHTSRLRIQYMSYVDKFYSKENHETITDYWSKTIQGTFYVAIIVYWLLYISPHTKAIAIFGNANLIKLDRFLKTASYELTTCMAYRTMTILQV